MALVLSPDEETEASGAWVPLVWYVYTETDDTGEELTWGLPLSIHHEAREAQGAADRRKGVPPPGAAPDGVYHVEGPCNLFALGCTGFVDEVTVRAGLKKKGPIDLVPHRWYSPAYYRKSLSTPPLTREESRQAAAAKVWIIYYEDQFHAGDARDSFPVAICLTKAEADAEVARRGPVRSGYDGYVSVGPSPLVRPEDRTSQMGSPAIREALRRLAAGEPGPVPAA
jgi:hypothetical protein